MTSNIQGRNGQGMVQTHGQQYERSEGLKHMTKDMLGEQRSPWGWGPKAVFSVAGYLGLSDLVTFCTWLLVYFAHVHLTAYHLPALKHWSQAETFLATRQRAYLSHPLNASSLFCIWGKRTEKMLTSLKANSQGQLKTTKCGIRENFSSGLIASHWSHFLWLNNSLNLFVFMLILKESLNLVRKAGMVCSFYFSTITI